MQPGVPATRFVETEKGFIGYQIFGAEKPDIVYLTNWVTNVDMYWEEPSAARFLDRLGTMGRVFLIDKRGSGVSDHPTQGIIDPVEDTLDDVRAVLAANGSEEAVLVGDTEGGALACILAATYPEQFPTLILVNSMARMARADDYPIGAPPHVMESFARDWRAMYGVSADTLFLTAPSVAGDQRFRTWYTWFQRQAMAPSVARAALRWIAATDVRSVLPSIQAETLVIHRKDALFHRLDFGRYLADHIPGARLEVVPGADTLPFHAGDTAPILDAIESFVTGHTGQMKTDRMLATVLISDIVGSTDLASDRGDEYWLDLRTDHNRIVRTLLQRFRGQELATTGDGFVATFDGPHRAIQCALAMVAELDEIGLRIRVGIHTGEIEMREGEAGGMAMHLAARVMSAAESGGVLVSGTVKDLVIGSPLTFESCGEFDLKGVPGSWRLFEVKAPALSAAV